MDINVTSGYPINEYIEIQTLYDHQFGVPIYASCFDSQQELFWTGNAQGRVTSYYGVSLSKYTSFSVPFDTNPEIKTIFPHREKDVYILNSDTLFCYSRLGSRVFKHKEVSFKNLECMFYNQQERFYLGGFNELIYDFDIERLRILRQFNITDDQKDCILIKSSASTTNMSSSLTRNGVLCTGSTNGQVVLRDPFSLKSIQKFHPHSGSLSDFDIHGNYLVTCGFSSTRGGALCIDRFLMVYDLRMMRSLNPVQLVIEPSFLHYLPMCSSVVAVASQSSCFQLTDTNLMTPSSFYQAQAPLGLAHTFSMSDNCQAVAFGHSSGSVHLFTKGENVLFNDFSEETLFIDPPQFSNAYIDINNEIAPLSSIPVPLTNEKKLISDWPNNSAKPEYRPSPEINPELMNNTRIIHGIISVPNRLDMKRNQIFDNIYQESLKLLEIKSHESTIPLIQMIKKEEFESTQVKIKGKEEIKEDKPKIDKIQPDNFQLQNLIVEENKT